MRRTSRRATPRSGWRGRMGCWRRSTRHKLDALIAPSMSPAWPTDHVLGDHFVGAGYGMAAVAGTPSLTVPIGDSFGLPLGITFMGRAHSEGELDWIWICAGAGDARPGARRNSRQPWVNSSGDCELGAVAAERRDLPPTRAAEWPSKKRPAKPDRQAMPRGTWVRVPARPAALRRRASARVRWRRRVIPAQRRVRPRRPVHGAFDAHHARRRARQFHR